ncbi:MAG: ABC transporter permease subunit [Eubacteriales bacterium]
MDNNKKPLRDSRFGRILYTLASPFRWLFTMWMGPSKFLDGNPEKYASPGRLAVQRFFRRPAACVALAVILCMFLFVFIGPLINPIDLSYSETLHKNLSPSYTMMNIPSALAKDVCEISSYSSFSLGIDNAGNVYTWGKTNLKDVGIDIADIPEEVKNSKIVHAAVGIDHAVAISEDGHIYCWGAYDNGQFGMNGTMISMAQVQPYELINGTIDVANVKQLVCGNQVTAIVMNDGTSYLWGNYNIGATNMPSFDDIENLEKVAFLQSLIVGITKDGQFVCGKTSAFDSYEILNPDGTTTLVNLWDYLEGHRVVDIAANMSNACLLLDDGSLAVVGASGDNSRVLPTIPEGESIVSIYGGARHYALLTDTGRVFTWGGNSLGQTDLPASMQEPGSADNLYCVGFQTYAEKSGEIVEKWGFKGYLMGTDELGRDVFVRVMNGGKMTMTIGAVAVIISTIIGIIIGCISGYFGGKVDMLLMRVTEIFSAIPFLPFALVLSAILRQTDVKEDTRIFLIMVVLGVLSWTGLARLIRGQVLSEREKEFVLAAQSMGVSESRIAFRHILPNVISVIIVSLTLDFAGCMLTEASLSYLGFGVQLPRPTWGNMLYGCNNSLVIRSYWWRWVFPALFLSASTISINVIGDTLRDILDPKSEVEK